MWVIRGVVLHQPESNDRAGGLEDVDERAFVRLVSDVADEDRVDVVSFVLTRHDYVKVVMVKGTTLKTTSERAKRRKTTRNVALERSSDFERCQICTSHNSLDIQANCDVLIVFLRSRNARRTDMHRAENGERRFDSDGFRMRAGCVVFDDQNRICLVESTSTPGKWSLPSGGVEVGEELTEAALRETIEEAGCECTNVEYLDVFVDLEAKKPTKTSFYIADVVRLLTDYPENSRQRRFFVEDELDDVQIRAVYRDVVGRARSRQSSRRA